MSPYCPTCLGVSGQTEHRCPLDQQFLRRRNCAECGQEIFPREIYCAACGFLNSEPEEVLLLPPEASPMKQFGALFLDYFTMGVLIFMLLWHWGPAIAILAFGTSGLLYRALGRAGGRQTFGQAVFNIATVSPNAGPCDVGGGFRRSFWEIVKCLKLALARPGVEAELEKLSGSLELSLG